MNPTFTCLICYQDYECMTGHQTLCDCQGTFCESCLAEWYTCLAERPNFSCGTDDDLLFNCPSPECKIKRSAKKVVQDTFRDVSKAEKVQESLLRVYLRTDPDIRRCPSTSCKFAGFVADDPKCKDNFSFTCPECGQDWKQQAHIQTDPMSLFVNCWHTVLDEILMDISADECPNCGIAISKEGGCSHMTCSKCCFEFCWFCKHPNDSHDQNLCRLAALTKSLILTLLLAPLILGTGLLPYLLTQITMFVSTLMFYPLWFNGTAGIGYFAGYILYDNINSDQNPLPKLGKIIGSFGLMVAAFYPLVQMDLFTQWIWTMLVEGAVFGAVKFFDNASRTWFENVL